MCSFKRIAVSNRTLCQRALPQQVERLKGKADSLILREKDLSEQAYERLAREVREACMEQGIELICHTFTEAAKNIGCTAIHLPFPLFAEKSGELDTFAKIGVSAHSLEQVLYAQAAGADYTTISPIFETDCKPGAAGRGLSFLRDICQSTSLEVYALGGITDKNEYLVRQAGAAGACRMSDFMK